MLVEPLETVHGFVDVDSSPKLSIRSSGIRKIQVFSYVYVCHIYLCSIGSVLGAVGILPPLA